MCAQRRVANHYHLSVSTRAAVWLSGVGLARDPHDMLHILYSKVCVTTQVTALCIYNRIDDRYNAHRAARKANIECRLSLLWVGISDISQTHLVICVPSRVSQTPKPRTFAYNIFGAVTSWMSPLGLLSCLYKHSIQYNVLSHVTRKRELNSDTKAIYTQQIQPKTPKLINTIPSSLGE